MTVRSAATADIEKQYGQIRPELAAMLYHRVNKLHAENLNWDEWMDFINTFQIVKANRNEILVRQGEVCQQLFFVLKGVLRCYTLEDGKDVNLHFYFQNDIASEFHSLRTASSSTRNLVCMTPSILLVGKRPDYLPMIENSHPLTLATMAFFAEKFKEEEEHSEMLKAKSPSERYHHLLTHEPQLVQNIPLSQLASYLGISRKSLSRIRSGQHD